jgi:glycosyltransferase involved in cell wall biosynthesis
MSVVYIKEEDLQFKPLDGLSIKAQNGKQISVIPEVSVITIVKNHEIGLRHTLNSLITQTFQNWESVIVVGESTDNTLGIAEEYAKDDTRFKVVAQHNSGIYEAMNLGISQSSSSTAYLNFMNAGDIYYEIETLANLVKIANLEKVGLIIGGYKVKDSATLYKQKQGNLADFRFTFSRRNGCHQSMIYSREAVLLAGGYDVKYRLAADHDLTLKILAHAGGKKAEFLVAEMEPGGLSDRSLTKLHKEKQAIRRHYFKNRPWVWLFGFIWQFAALFKISLRYFLIGKKHPFG